MVSRMAPRVIVCTLQSCLDIVCDCSGFLCCLLVVTWTFGLSTHTSIMCAKFVAALIDLSGTLHIEDIAIPGAVEALRRYTLYSSFISK